MSLASETYFISVGEYSGDLLAAEVVQSIREFRRDLQPFGIVGPALKEKKIDEIGNISDLSMMGIADVATQASRLKLLETSILASIDRRKPLFALLVDFPGFHFRLAEQLKLRGIPVFQFVAPKVWAWGSSRLENLRRDFRKVFGILPFEKNFFASHGVPYEYVGTPILDRVQNIAVSKEDFGISSDTVVITFLPGSRESEISHVMPTMLETAQVFSSRHKNKKTKFFVPVAGSFVFENFRSRFSPTSTDDSLPLKHFIYENIIFVSEMSLELMKISNACVVCSGTATLECGLLGTPMVVVYSMGDFFHMIATRLVQVPYASLVNLIAGKAVVKEFIQNFRISDIVSELEDLVFDQGKRAQMQSEFDAIADQLLGRAADRCARGILSELESDL